MLKILNNNKTIKLIILIIKIMSESIALKNKNQ